MRVMMAPRRWLMAIDERIGIETFKLGIVLATVYFVQGMGGLSNIPLLFYFKDVLHFNEAQLQYFTAITSIAWLVKPLFGFISDRWPLFGYRRKSYMILMAGTAALSWWMLAVMTYFGVTDYITLVLIFNISSLGYAFVDVVCDAIMVERGQAQKMERVFVNIQWFALGIAGAIAAFSGGYLQEMIKAGDLSLHWVFAMTGLIPFLTGTVAIAFINEQKFASDEDATKIVVGWAEVREIVSMRTFWLLTAFIFFWKYSPSFGSVFAYYRIDILKFEPQFLGDLAAIGKAIFPLSIILYAGLLRYFPRISAKHYLYGSIVIGIAYYAMNWLFLVPEAAFGWIQIPVYVTLAPAVVFATTITATCLYIFTAIFKSRTPMTAKGIATAIARLNDRAADRYGTKKIFIFLWLLTLGLSFTVSLWFAGIDLLKSVVTAIAHLNDMVVDRYGTKKIFVFLWLLTLGLSFTVSLWFAGIDLLSVNISYRSLAVINEVLFSYATIASFIIPLALAAELAPKRAEGMTYAYFMALSNISAIFLPDISGAYMFEVLKAMLINKAPIISSLPFSQIALVIMFTVAYIMTIIVFADAKKTADNIASLLMVSLVGVVFSYYVFLPIIVDTAVTTTTYLVQQSYLLLASVIGQADFLGAEAYRALILRYALIIGVIFITISTFFVYLLPDKKREKQD